MFFYAKILFYSWKCKFLGENLFFTISENNICNKKKTFFYGKAILSVRKLHAKLQGNISTNNIAIAD